MVNKKNPALKINGNATASDIRKECEKKVRKVTRECEKKIENIKSEFRQLSRQILDDQERERNSIGKELHDEVGGYLTMLGIYLSKMNKEPENKTWTQQFTQSLDEMVQYVRALSHALYPVMLERGDLLTALATYIEGYQRRTGVTVFFKHKGLEKRFPTHLEAVIYRIIQEALTNTAKHASANRASVNLIKEQNNIKLSIEDNGCGFDLTHGLPAGKYGIAGMKNRAIFVGGNLDIKSSPGNGTRVSVTIPIR